REKSRRYRRNAPQAAATSAPALVLFTVTRRGRTRKRNTIPLKIKPIEIATGSAPEKAVDADIREVAKMPGAASRNNPTATQTISLRPVRSRSLRLSSLPTTALTND